MMFSSDNKKALGVAIYKVDGSLIAKKEKNSKNVIN